MAAAVTESEVMALIESGELKAEQAGAQVRLSRDVLEAWLEAGNQGSIEEDEGMGDGEEGDAGTRPIASHQR